MAQWNFEVAVSQTLTAGAQNNMQKIDPDAARKAAKTRSLDNNFLEDGDILYIPDEFPVFEAKIPGATNKSIVFLLPVLRGSKWMAVQIYASAFSKRVALVEKQQDGTYKKTGDTKSVGGDVPKILAGFDNYYDGLMSLQGQYIDVQVSAPLEVGFLDRTTNELTVRSTKVCSFNKRNAAPAVPFQPQA